MPGRRRSRFRGLWCAGVLLASGLAGAQDYPTRGLRLVVPYPPGGNSDATAREIAKRLSDRLGRPVVVDNRPGASTVIGSEIVARSPADGYTLLMAGTGHAINASVLKLPYDTLLSVQPQVRSGKLRALAVSGATRLAALPELPTIAQAGLPGFEVTGWNGIVTTGGTPRAIVDRLGAEVAAIAHATEVRQRFAQQGGGELVGSTPDEFAAFIRTEVSKWAKVVRDSKIEAQ